MTDNTEPTINKQIISLLEKDYGFYKGMEQVYLPLVADLEALISDQVAKARIEETKLYKQYFKGRTQGYANARIDVLEKELATKRSKE